MKPLYHPTIENISVEGILYALADPVRVRIFVQIGQCEGHMTCSTFLNVNNKTIPKSTLSQHFKVLREAGLVRSVRNGIELHNTTRCTEIKPRFGAMVNAIVAAYAMQDKRQRSRKKR